MRWGWVGAGSAAAGVGRSALGTPGLYRHILPEDPALPLVLILSR